MAPSHVIRTHGRSIFPVLSAAHTMLSSLLLNKTTNVDPELDALFKSKDAVAKPDLAKKRKLDTHHEAPAKRPKPSPQSSKEDDSEADLSTLVHESLSDKSKSSRKQKYVPLDETPAQKDLRTIFVGNLPLQVAQKRPLQKQLQRHILSFIPSAKIQSTRFRSVPFNTPTSNLSSSSSSSSSSPTTTTTTPTHKNPSQRDHNRTRASSRKSKEASTNDPNPPSSKPFLNSSQKKKIAFINREFHTTADTVHAYIVFAYPVPSDSRPKNLPPLEPVLDPFVAVKEVVKKADGSLFMDRIIRVDAVGEKTKTGEEEQIGAFGDADPKCTLFVGNLEFTSEEGDLRLFFENLMKTERGEPPSDEEQKPHAWVRRVRVIKDKETQLGKGFAYVQFIDRECVDTLLTFSPDQLKFAKRKLRINRCKTLQGTQLSSAVKSKLSQSSVAQSQKGGKSERKPVRPTERIEIPKGDPALGMRLVHLSKEQRKEVKASDADRVARRLAKKKARMGMGVGAGESLGSEAERKRRRERVRKVRTTAMVGGGGKKKEDLGRKKGRVRSEKSLEKRNMKK